MDSKLLAYLPELHVEHDQIYIAQVGPPAAFRLLNLKEIRGFTTASYVGDFFVTDAIIRRTILYPTVKEYDEALSGIHEIVASDILKLSAPSTPEEVSTHLIAARQQLDGWIEAMQFLIFRHFNIPMEKVAEMQFSDMLPFIVGLEAQLETDFDPTKIDEDPKSPRKPQDRLTKAKMMHDRAEVIRRSQEVKETPSTPPNEPTATQHDGKFVVSGAESHLDQNAAKRRKARWDKLEEGMEYMEEHGRDPAEISLTSIYEDHHMQKLTASAIGKSNLTIQTLPLDIMASIKHIRKKGSNTGLDFKQYSYLGE